MVVRLIAVYDACVGMSRMPKIQDRVEKFFDKKASKAINPEEAVSFGSIVYGTLREKFEQQMQEPQLDTVPLSVGLEIQNGEFLRVFPRGTALPAKRRLHLNRISASQNAAYIKIFQGEREWAPVNTSIGSLLVEELNTERFPVIFFMEKSGKLTITAKTGAEVDASGTCNH